MKKYLQIILIIALLLIAAFFYTYKLSEIPKGLYVDEAVVGYNAFSILQTGKDEYGAFLPVAFRFFGSYTPPLYVYLLVPIIGLLNLSIFSTRLLSVICGISMILIIYIFLKKLDLYKYKWTPLIGALIFSITPYAFFYARVGYEVYLGLTLLSLGALLAYLGLENKKLLLPSFIILSLSAYTAYSQKYLIPLFVLGYFLTFRKTLFTKANLKSVLVASLAGILIQLPNLSFVLSPAFLIKGDLFYIEPIQKTASFLAHFMPTQLAFIIATIREFGSQYVTYFSPRSLFLTPDPDLQRSLPDLSIFYTWMLIPYLLGLFVLWKNKKSKAGQFLIMTLLITPIPAAITGDPFSTQRALSTLLPLSLVIILGIDSIIKNTRTKIWIPLGGGILLLSLLFLWRSYFILLPLERSQAWSYGFEQLADFIKTHPDNHFVIDQYQTKPAYIELAFFLKYPPQKFQQELLDQTIKDNYYSNTKWDYHYQFGNIKTSQIDFQRDLCKSNILVGSETTFSPNDIKENHLNQVINIKDSLGQVVFVGYEVLDNSKCKDGPNLKNGNN